MSAALNWLNPFKHREAKVERKVVLGTSESLGSFLIFGTGTGATPASALSLYEKSSAVSIPINAIVDPFKVMEPMLLIGDTVIKDAPVIQFLKNPSPYYSLELLLEMLGKEYLITNECSFVALGRPNFEPTELQPISPASVSVNQGQGGLVQSYIIAGNTLPGSYLPKLESGNRVRYFVSKGPNLREFKQIRGYSTRNNSLLRGQSRLVSASREVRQHILGGNHNISLLEKGGRVSLVFHFDAEMGQEDFEITKERVLEQYAGTEKAGQIGVTSGGKLDVKNVGTKNIDMDFANLQKMAIKAVALQYRYPLPLIIDENQTLDNYREGKLAAYDDAVIPLSQIIFGGLGEILLPRFGLDPAKARIVFDPDKITALVSRRNDELLKRSKLNIESDNELRAFISREPYDGGDVILKPANLIPAGSDLFTLDNEKDILEPELVE